MRRKHPIAVGEIHHVVSKSIAGYQIFNTPLDYERFLRMLDFFGYEGMSVQFYELIHEVESRDTLFETELRRLAQTKNKRISLAAYCIMPTHIHLVIKEIQQDGISKFVGDLLNSYSRYFNLKHRRQGPLWAGPFKNIPCQSDEQLLHLTRYVHLNPVTAHLIDRPENWLASSYHEYIEESQGPFRCEFKSLISMNKKAYALFTNNQISYQRDLAKIKKLLLE